MDAILLTLQIVGCQEERIHKESEGIQAFTPDRITKEGLRYPGPTQSESTGLLNLSHHSTLADYMKSNGRLTMFLPSKNNTITWGSAYLAEDTEICMAMEPSPYYKILYVRRYGRISREKGKSDGSTSLTRPKQTLLYLELGVTG